MANADDPRMGSLFTERSEKELANKSVKIALIGYANDEGVSRNGGRKGAARGPSVVRRILKKKGCINNEEYSLSLEDVEIKDFGDSSQDKNLKCVHKSHQMLVEGALSEGYLPIVIGGGNDQSYPNFMALLSQIESASKNVREEKMLVINIDAHLDVRPLLQGDEPHSGSPFRQVFETKSDIVLKVVEFASQGSQCSSEHVKYVQRNGGDIVWLKDLHDSILTGERNTTSVANLFEEVISKESYNSCFVSFDIDSIRSGDCPGVSCPSPIGLTSEEALAICYKAGKCRNVRMLDISEFNPEVEDYMTGTLVANMVYYFIMGVVARGTFKK